MAAAPSAVGLAGLSRRVSLKNAATSLAAEEDVDLAAAGVALSELADRAGDGEDLRDEIDRRFLGCREHDVGRGPDGRLVELGSLGAGGRGAGRGGGR